jgi:probable rRNA maturation factor
MTPAGARRAAGDVPPALALAVQYAAAPSGLPVRSTIRRWARAALEGPACVTVRFVGGREGRALNARYRGKDYATNVLTFVYDDVEPLSGDLVLCAPVLRREARQQRTTLTAHCAHLVVHGMLHLQGFDHERPRDAARMEAREARVLGALGYSDPYAREQAAAASRP